MPQIRINIAEATENPQTSMDIASIPGRLVPIKDKIMTPAEPEFGVSGTLSKILIKISANGK